ncbi:MAG: hypothetical protein ABJE66_04995 [Deltaproteobacteria bacterium]
MTFGLARHEAIHAISPTFAEALFEIVKRNTELAEATLDGQCCDAVADAEALDNLRAIYASASRADASRCTRMRS